jgi:hypothetical protein
MAETIDKVSHDYELPQHLMDALEDDVLILTHEQLRELIEIEAAALLGLAFEEAEERARAGTLPKDAFGTNIETLFWLYHSSAT